MDESNPDIVYMGCYRKPGHHAYFPGMRPARDPKYYAMDSKKYPRGYEKDGRKYWLPEGRARVDHTEGGWTYLSWNDYSIDDRPGSHCVFLMRGTLTFDEAFAKAKANFAPVIDALPYEVTEWEETNAT